MIKPEYTGNPYTDHRIVNVRSADRMTEEQLQMLGGKLAQMKSLEMAFDKIAEDISIEINMPIWRVHASYENISHKLIPHEGNITIATKFINHQERG